MKVKTIVTGCNRKQLRSKCLALDVENKQLKREMNELKPKFYLQEKLLKDITDKLIEQKSITCSTSKAAEEMAHSLYNQSKQLEEANQAISQRDNTINHQNRTISALQIKVIELSNEIDRLKQPFWRKWGK